VQKQFYQTMLVQLCLASNTRDIVLSGLCVCLSVCCLRAANRSISWGVKC